MREFLEDRIRLVRELVQAEIDVAYADLALILTAVLSACAATRWPGQRNDRRRFIELLIRHSPPDAHADWVSVPALINRNLVAEADTRYGPGESTRIFRDHEIDLDLGSAHTTFDHLSVSDLKSCSYAALIYGCLRCGYAHEYCPAEYITPMQASRFDARVSYIGRGTPDGLIRVASFHLDYLIDLADHHASGVPDQPSPVPNEWWIDSA